MICTKSCNLLLDDLAQSIFYLEWRTFGLDLDFDFGGFCLRLLDCHVISELVQVTGFEPANLEGGSVLQTAATNRIRLTCKNGGARANRTPIPKELPFSRRHVSPSTAHSKNLLPDFYATPYLLYQNRSGSGNRVIFQPFGRE